MRNQWKIMPKLVVGLATLILTVGAGGFAVSLVNRSSSAFRNLPEFPTAEYRAGDPLWNNSAYRLSGTLDNILLESKNRDQYLVAVTPKGAGSPLPVVIPAKAPRAPLQHQQKLSLKVTVDSSGRITASACAID